MALLSTMRTCLFHRLATLLSVISQETLFGAMFRRIMYTFFLYSLHAILGTQSCEGVNECELVFRSRFFDMCLLNSPTISSDPSKFLMSNNLVKTCCSDTISFILCAKSRIQWTWTRQIQATTTHQNVTYFDFTFRQPIPANQNRHYWTHTHTHPLIQQSPEWDRMCDRDRETGKGKLKSNAYGVYIE